MGKNLPYCHDISEDEPWVRKQNVRFVCPLRAIHMGFLQGLSNHTKTRDGCDTAIKLIDSVDVHAAFHSHVLLLQISSE